MEKSEIQTLKKEIRKTVFQRRKEADPQKLIEDSAAIMEQLYATDAYKEASCIYAYMDYNKEVMTRSLCERAWADGKQVAVPKVHGKDMIYYILTTFDQLEEGYFHIPEPAWGEEANCEDALMILPGVAFDRNLHRVGYGGGFYDRYLEKHTGHVTCAVAFEFQLVEEAPAEPTDIFPQMLITEKTIYRQK
ncbi:MAG: 5-formyltetrahydrofolate cyclo-ligase [Lachnospiraceae bacterium]|nr:5-formyltetrahydrofolate cyclo-ligase [Lachnospiraceae bacterium]